MTVFDEILPTITEILHTQSEKLSTIDFVVNRDLNGRVRLIFDAALREKDELEPVFAALGQEMSDRLGRHGFPGNEIVIFESSLESVKENASLFQLEGFENVTIADRLAVDPDWSNIRPPSNGVPRIVFFSIKGGVGRSTAIAAVAWALAQQGKNVMILDLDLESPGLSSHLLPKERRPACGVADWLIEDLIDNGDSLLENIFASSELSHNGTIHVVPAHGEKPGEYISKLGRIWMPKVNREGKHESWSRRLNRLLTALEKRLQPDVVLIDSRSGIDETASACITALGAKKILLFATDSEQTWAGYEILFRYWLKIGVIDKIRERVQIVGALIPEIEREKYCKRLYENAWDVFIDNFYDEVAADDAEANLFSYDKDDEAAPHFPWRVRWNQGFASLQSLHSRMLEIDNDEVRSIFGALIDGVSSLLGESTVNGNE
jgi:cellulose biosynthesis protein BcsQ